MTTGAAHRYEAIADTGLYQDLNRTLLELAPRLDGRAVLDLGCGTGAMACLVLESGAADVTLWALDPDAEMVEAARANVGSIAGVMEASAENFGTLFPERSLDVIFLANCIHLVADLDAFLANVRRTLRPGGLLAFNTAFFAGAEHPRDRPLYWRLVLEGHKQARTLTAGAPRGTRARPLAKRPFDAAFYRDRLAEVGLAVQVEKRRTIELDATLVELIIGSPMFAAGALPGVPPSTAAQALVAAFGVVRRERPNFAISRDWLYVVAEKES